MTLPQDTHIRIRPEILGRYPRRAEDYFSGAIWWTIKDSRMEDYRAFVQKLFMEGWRIAKIERWMFPINSNITGRTVAFRFPNGCSKCSICIYESLFGAYTTSVKLKDLLIEFEFDFVLDSVFQGPAFKCSINSKDLEDTFMKINIGEQEASRDRYAVAVE